MKVCWGNQASPCLALCQLSLTGVGPCHPEEPLVPCTTRTDLHVLAGLSILGPDPWSREPPLTWHGGTGFAGSCLGRSEEQGREVTTLREAWDAPLPLSPADLAQARPSFTLLSTLLGKAKPRS